MTGPWPPNAQCPGEVLLWGSCYPRLGGWGSWGDVVNAQPWDLRTD